MKKIKDWKKSTKIYMAWIIGIVSQAMLYGIIDRKEPIGFILYVPLFVLLTIILLSEVK